MANRYTYDTIVIGAGVYGLASAWRLAQAGQKVLVLDRAGVGSEASGFALGRIDPLLGGVGARNEDGSVTKSEAQASLGLRGHALLLEHSDLIQETSGVDFEIDHQPTLQLCYSDEQRSELETHAAQWAGQGFKSEFLEPDEFARIDDRIARTPNGGLLLEGPFFLDALKFVYALAACAEAAGAVLATGDVSALDIESDSVTVTAGGATHSSAAALIAAGPWSGPLAAMAGVTLPITPSKGEIIRLGPPEGAQLPVHLHGPCSLVHKKDGMVWAAATSADQGFDRAPTGWALEKLSHDASSMMPAMADAPVLMRTVCFRPASPDGLPIVGRIRSNAPVWVATGGGGSGIMQSLLIGDAVAGMITSGADEGALPGTSPQRFA